MRPRLGRALSWAIAGALAAVCLYGALRGVEWRGVWHIVAHADGWYLAAAAATSITSYFLRSVRWRVLLNAEGSFSVGTVFWANMAGYLGNSFLPARAGEVARSFLISSRSSLSIAYVLTTALGERLMDAIALVLCSSLILLGVHPKPAWMEDLSRTLAIVAGLGAVTVAVLPHAGPRLNDLLRRIPLPAGIEKRLLALTEQIFSGLRAFHDWNRFGAFVLLTVAIWLIDAGGVILGVHALGLRTSLPVALLLLSGLGLGSALPSTPGYVGIYQFVAVTVLTPFGFTRDAALAYILVAQTLGYVVVLILGLPAIYRMGGVNSFRRTRLA
jgi:glycosyltransferase 2 family protein